jgi:hypothetical protein
MVVLLLKSELIEKGNNWKILTVPLQNPIRVKNS